MDSFQARPSFFSLTLSAPLQHLFFIFGIRSHCSLLKSDLTRKAGSVPSGQVLFYPAWK